MNVITTWSRRFYQDLIKHGETKAQEDSTAEPEKVQYQYMAQK